MAEERPVDLDDASGRGDDAGSRDVPDRGVPDEDRAVGGLGVATRTVGVLDPTLGRHLPVVADRVLLVEDVQGVRLAVVGLAQHR